MPGETKLITAALPYINNVPHMGHIVGSHLPADIFYRYSRARGDDAIFIGGSDEHGTPSVVTAKEYGITPRQLADKLNSIHAKVYRRMNIDYTNYSRTSNPLHHQTVDEFFRVVFKKGHIHKATEKTYFCEHENMGLPDRFVEGTCPACGYEQANGDQCESCSTILTAPDLLNPKCKSCDETPVLKDSEHLYLDLKGLAGTINNWIDSQKSKWRPHVYSEAKKWINEGLKSRSITRDMDWGVKVPLNGFQDKVFYVWFDAPIGYMTFTRELGEETFEKYWKNPEAQIYHFLGKDNIPFHTIFWPGMLLAHGDLNLPTSVVGYNYLNFEGQKFSKSKGIGVFCYNLLNSDINIDIMRSYLTTVIPDSRDSDFNWELFRNITNSELIGKFGNFFNRTLNLIWNNYDGKLDTSYPSDITDQDASMINSINDFTNQIAHLYSNTSFREAYRAIMHFASEGNAYLERNEPWRLIKNGQREEAKKSLYIALHMAKALAISASPILPETMQKLWKEQLNLPGNIYDKGIWNSATQLNIPSDHRINQPFPLYKKIDDAELENIKKELSKPHDLEELVSN